MNGQTDREGKEGKKSRERGKIEKERREWDNRKLRRLLKIRRKVRGREKKEEGG